MKCFHLFAVAALTGLLVACGGRGSSPDTTTAATTTETDYISKYVGTWKGTCHSISEYKDTSNNNAGSYFIATVVITKSSNTKAIYRLEHAVYASTDSTCSGPVVATIIKTGLNTGQESTSGTTFTSSLGEDSFTYAGPASIPDAPGAENTDGVSSNLTARDSLTVGTVSLIGSDFLGKSGKGALYLKGSTLSVGQKNSGGVSYPVTLETWPVYTKQ